MKLQAAPYGKTEDGRDVTLFTLTNLQGHSVELTDWGATIVAVRVPNQMGRMENVTLGFPSLDGYLQRHPFFGSTVGRYCNRIARGKFSIDGREYTLATNNGPNHLHGGRVGFDAQLWEAEPIETGDEVGVKFFLHSPAGQEGYPGNVDVTARYTWNDQNELTYTFSATADAPTHVNLTNHAYWNLGGAGDGKVLDHLVEIAADAALDVDETLIPTGKLNEVAGTPLDFREPRKVGERIDQLAATGGYDHCYVVRGAPGALRFAARVFDPHSRRVMEVETTQPGVQFYTGNHLPGDERSGGYGGHEGLCLETQHYPDSPNRPEFPTTLLRPGHRMRETTIHRFGVQRRD